jgi:hypothetical protein
MWWKKKPVTHAIGLWILVGVSILILAATTVYSIILARTIKGLPTVFPIRDNASETNRNQTVYGRVLSVNGDTFAIDSKQPYGLVLIDDLTNVTMIAGGGTHRSSIVAGSLITATGKDLGAGHLRADAIVILGTGETRAANILQAPKNWQDWCETMPRLIGWGKKSSDYFLAVRDCNPRLPAVSVLLYGADGSVTERLEIDVPGYRQTRPLNPFLTPVQVEKELSEKGIEASTSPVSPDGKHRLEDFGTK